MWWNIGIQLCFRDGDLAAIKKNHPEDCGGCFRTLLADWLNQSNPTWKALIDALKAPIVGIKVNFQQDSQGI